MLSHSDGWLRIFDSVTDVTEQCCGLVVVTGSHGGEVAAAMAARHRVRAAIFSDAGIGRDEAGVRGLGYLEKLGVPAAAADYQSARIGDGRDIYDRGIISRVNGHATALGCGTQQVVADAAWRMRNSVVPAESGPELPEMRTLLADGPVPVWALDSASLVRPEDTGAILITGSHGGLIGHRSERALKVDALAAVFVDAGVGADQAGITRLVALDYRGIAAVAVSVESARIGDALSVWETGVVSHLNETAGRMGARAEMTVKEFVDAIAATVAARCGGASGRSCNDSDVL